MAAMLDLRFLADPYAVCWLEATAPIPAWVEGEGFLSILRAEDDLTVACRQSRVPPEESWARWELPLLSGLTGILAAPLAQAGEGIFAVSTYSTRLPAGQNPSPGVGPSGLGPGRTSST